MLKLPTRSALSLTAWANLLSTLVGIPLTWIVLLIVQGVFGLTMGTAFPGWPSNLLRVILFPAWFPPGANRQTPWLIPAAALALCVPFFLMSVSWEGGFMRDSLRDRTPQDDRRWAWRAHLLTYGLIVAGLVVVVFLAARPADSK